MGARGFGGGFHPPYGPDREPDTDREGPLMYKLKAADHH